MMKFLSSMKLAAIMLISLIVVFLCGIFLTANDGVYEAFKHMNDIIILDWIMEIGNKNIYVVIWFVILCLIAFLFGINLFLCTKDRLYKTALTSKSLKASLLFSIHIVFIIILLLHAVSLVIGFKHGNIVLSAGDKYEFENGYTLRLKEINFVDDFAILKDKKKSSRLEMTRDKFHYKENYASLSLFKNGEKVVDGSAFIFSPVSGDGIQITLEKFILDKMTKEPAVRITVAKNPLVLWFFVFYALGILSLTAYLFVRDR